MTPSDRVFHAVLRRACDWTVARQTGLFPASVPEAARWAAVALGDLAVEARLLAGWRRGRWPAPDEPPAEMVALLLVPAALVRPALPGARNPVLTASYDLDAGACHVVVVGVDAVVGARARVVEAA